MKRAMINKVHLEGLLYQHKLEFKETGPQSKNPGTQYIRGTVEIATDEDGLNVIPVYYSYVTAKTSTGKDDSRFKILNDIINGDVKSVMQHGRESADSLRIDTSINLNDYYTDQNGGQEPELRSSKRNEGGFIHVGLTPTTEDEDSVRNYFETDMVITNVYRKEADEERQIPEKVIVKGAIFGYKNALLPIEYSVTNPEGMTYFEGLGATNKEPVFTRVWGSEVSQTVVTRQESAFGEALVRPAASSRKDFVITGVLPEPYMWDDESTITAADLEKAMQDRQLYLATVKQRYLNYKTQAPQKQATTAPQISHGDFDF